MLFDDGVVLERVAARLLHQAQVFVAAHHVGNTFDQLHTAAFFIFQRFVFGDAGNIDRASREAKQAQVVLLDRLVRIRLRVGGIQPL